MSETPFTIQVADSDLELLCKKLELTHLPDELDDAGWDYGSPLTDIRRLVNRWKNGFDWRASEATINKLPQFTRDIEVEGFGALNIHYVHKRSEVESSIPLLFIHGCKQPSAHCIVYVTDNIAVSISRARIFPRSSEDPPLTSCIRSWPSEFSRCRVQLAWLWILRGTEKQRIRHSTICRDMSQDYYFW